MLTQAYSIHYGAFEVGGSTGYPINGPVRATRSLDRGSLSFQVGVLGTSDSDLATKISAFEAAFTARRLRIRWMQSAATRLDWDPSGTTDETMGFNSEAIVEKVGTPGGDTGRSVLYNVTLVARLPVVDQAGLKGLTVNVTAGTNCIRTVVIEGVVTAKAEPSAQTASEVYAASGAGFCTTQLTAIDASAVWKFQGDTTSRDETDTELRFTRTYLELALDTGEAVPSSAAVRDFALVITDITQAPGDSGPNVVRLREFLIAVSASLCVSTINDPEAYWRSDMRDFVLNYFRGKYGPDEMAVTSEQVTPSRYGNSLSVVLQVTASIGATDVVQSIVTTEVTVDPGNVVTGAWTGQAFAGYVDQGLGIKTRSVTIANRVRGIVSGGSGGGESGTTSGASFGGGGSVSPNGGPWGTDGGSTFTPDPIGGGLSPSGGGGGGSSGWIDGPTVTRTSPVFLGKPGEEQLTYTDLVQTRTDRYVVKPSGSLSGTGLQPSAGGSSFGIGGGALDL